MPSILSYFFLFTRRRRHTSGALVTGVQTCALPITCDGNMEEGSLRCDANVSVRRPGDSMGTRCEIKNVNSIRYVRQAIEYEARRQTEILEDGGSIDQETRMFDPGRRKTRTEERRVGKRWVRQGRPRGSPPN